MSNTYFSLKQHEKKTASMSNTYFLYVDLFRFLHVLHLDIFRYILDLFGYI